MGPRSHPGAAQGNRRSILTRPSRYRSIFAWPGIGKWLVDLIFRRDYPSVQGALLLNALLVMSVNLLVDLLYGLINPRIRHAK